MHRRVSLAFSPGMNLFVDDFRNQFHCLNLIFFTAKTSPPKARNLIRMLCNCHNNQHSFYMHSYKMNVYIAIQDLQ